MKRQNVRTLSFIVSCLTYLLVGATIFESLESFNEKTTKKRLDQIEDYYKNTYNISDREYQKIENFVLDNYLVRKILIQWVSMSYKFKYSTTRINHNGIISETIWRQYFMNISNRGFTGSAFFSLTVITTIGKWQYTRV